jgi:hypothetical protein
MVAMSRDRDPRDGHTRPGWWLMTHESVLNLVVGVAAVGLLVVDVSYLALRWRGFGTCFDRGFLLGFAGPLISVLAMKSLGLFRPIGSAEPVKSGETVGRGV